MSFVRSYISKSIVIAPRLSDRLQGLDALRWVCAISVLFWHYQHFYYTAPSRPISNFEVSMQPLYGIFGVFYGGFFFGVPIFWIISGVVIAKNYSGSAVKISQFAKNRFARLYPLALATLTLMFFLQELSKFLVKKEQIYPNNGFQNLILNTLMISNGSSFDGPLWTVSVELFSYLVFALFFLKIRNHSFLLACSLAILFLLLYKANLITVPFVQQDQLWLCGAYFFMGVACETLYRLISSKLFFGLLLLVTVFSYLLRSHFWMNILIVLFFLRIDQYSGWKKKQVVKKIRTLGNSTYSIYLIHVPLQVLILVILDYLQISSVSIANKLIFFLAYFILVQTLGIFVFRRFEKPIQNRILTGQ